MRLRSLLAALLLLAASPCWGATTFLEAGTDETADVFSFYVNLGGTGNITSDATTPHTGPRALKVVSDANAHNPLVATPNGILSDAGSRMSWWVDFSAMPGATSQWFTIANSGGANLVQVEISTGGVLALVAGSPPVTKTGSTLGTGTYNRLSLALVITNTTNYTVKLFLNGTPDVTMTNADTALNNSGASAITIGWNSNNGTGTYFLDDLYVDDGNTLDDPGDIRVTAKRPFANGTTNGFTTQIGSGGSGYGTGHSPQVNERPLSTSNGWSMVGAGSAVTEEYTVENAATGDVNLTGAPIVDSMGWVYASSLASETGSIIVKGATSNISLTNTNTLFTKAAGSTSYPSGGAAIGIVTDTTLTTVSLYEAGILIAYKPAPPVGPHHRSTIR